MQRRLAAIMVADAVASTAAMEQDEETAVLGIAAQLEALATAVANHQGRVFNTAGDSLLAEFASPVNALRAALEGRARLAAEGDGKAMRFGVHLADVIAVGDDLRGDGVNIAARIQGEAGPGDILVSDTLYAHVRRASPCTFHEPEQLTVKGVSEPLEVYRVKAKMGQHVYNTEFTRSDVRTARRPNSVAVAPFRTASSADEDQTFLADGLTEDLILELSRVRSLFVVSRTALNAMRDRDAEEIGDAAGVSYVLSGSVRKLGSRVRLNISLTNTETVNGAGKTRHLGAAKSSQ